MITSKSIYLNYKQMDLLALGLKPFSFKKRVYLFFNPNYILQFQRTLRKLEYFSNVKPFWLFGRFYILFIKYKYKRLSLKLGFSIPPNVFGPGLAIVHYGTIVV